MNRNAFSLVELLVIIAILAVVSVLLVPVFASARTSNQGRHDLSNQRQLQCAGSMYAEDSNGFALAELSKDATAPTNPAALRRVASVGAPYWGQSSPEVGHTSSGEQWLTQESTASDMLLAIQPKLLTFVDNGDRDLKTVEEPAYALAFQGEGPLTGTLICKYDCPNGGTLGYLPGSNPPLLQCIFTGCTLLANQPTGCPASIDPLYEAPTGTPPGCPTGDSTQTQTIHRG